MKIFHTFLVSIFLTSVGFSAQADMKIVTSIPPIAAIAKRIGQDKVDVDSILDHSVSAHFHHVKPSDVIKIQEADLVFWVGPHLEAYFEKPFRQAVEQGKAFSLMQIPDLNLLQVRKGGVWKHSHIGDKGHDHHDHFEDPHIWLDYENMHHIIDLISAQMSKVDPRNAQYYAQEAKRFKEEINQFNAETKDLFGSYPEMAFLVFHDGYQYFEKSYGLNGVGAISFSHDQALSPHRVGEIMDLVKQKEVSCIFTEPYYHIPLIENLARDEGVYVGRLDPLGSGDKIDEEYYLSMMQKIRDNFIACFKHHQERISS